MVLVLAAVAWVLRDVLLLVFASLLLAVFDVGESEDLLERARSVATTTTGALTAFGLWIFLAVLLSATPRTYIRRSD